MNTIVLNTTSTNKSNQSLYSRFKPLLATFVSTVVLVSCMAAPTNSQAAPTNSQVAVTDKFCYNVSSLMSSVIQNNTDKRAIELIENAIAFSKKDEPTLAKVHFGLESMLYFALTKKGIYKGDQMTKLLILNCPSFFD